MVIKAVLSWQSRPQSFWAATCWKCLTICNMTERPVIICVGCVCHWLDYRWVSDIQVSSLCLCPISFQTFAVTFLVPQSPPVSQAQVSPLISSHSDSPHSLDLINPHQCFPPRGFPVLCSHTSFQTLTTSWGLLFPLHLFNLLLCTTIHFFHSFHRRRLQVCSPHLSHLLFWFKMTRDSE